MSQSNYQIKNPGLLKEEGSSTIIDKGGREENWPLVTVITPTYNQGEFLEAAIRSVLLQGYPNLEYMVIDGGSTDGSVDIIRRYSDQLAYWVSEKDRGQSQAINKGLERAKGVILGWLNSDDILMPGTLIHAVTFLKNNEDIDVVYGHLDRIDQNGKLIPTPKLPKDTVDFNKRTVLLECVVNQPGCFWRKRIMDKVGFLNETLHFGLDYEYWTRMLMAGAKFKRVNETVAQFRLSKSSKTVGQATKMAIESIDIINTFLDQPEFSRQLALSSKELQRQANKGRGNYSLQAFHGCLKEKDWINAYHWLVQAHKYDLFALFRRKWLSLAMARIVRIML